MTTRTDNMRWYARLMKLAHELAMEGRGQEAQDLRVAAMHARMGYELSPINGQQQERAAPWVRSA